jgi:xylulokinase
LGVTLSAGGSLKWYKENFNIQPSLKEKNPGLSEYALMDIQAKKINPGSDGLIFLPYLLGERAPYADPSARGTFFGISYMHRQDHFSRSIMEGVAFSQYDCFKLIKKMGIDAKEIIVFGGGSKSDVWRQIIADVFNRKVVLLNIKEMPSYGAALLAGHGVGIFESLESVIKNNIKEISFQEPDPDRNKTYRKFYKIYQSLYKSLKKDFKKLGDINIKAFSFAE